MTELYEEFDEDGKYITILKSDHHTRIRLNQIIVKVQRIVKWIHQS